MFPGMKENVFGRTRSAPRPGAGRPAGSTCEERRPSRARAGSWTTRSQAGRLETPRERPPCPGRRDPMRFDEVRTDFGFIGATRRRPPRGRDGRRCGAAASTRPAATEPRPSRGRRYDQAIEWERRDSADRGGRGWGSPRWIGRSRRESASSGVAARSDDVQRPGRHAHASAKRVVETDGGVGESVRPEHEGPEHGAGRQGVDASSGTARASIPAAGSRTPTAALWLT
jgi:hypothetical protein